MKLFPDFVELLAAFDAEGVSFIVVGGYAVAFHGKPRATKDLDLSVSASPDNLLKLGQALARFGAPSEIVRQAGLMGPDDILYFGQSPMRVDLLCRVEASTTVGPSRPHNRRLGSPVGRVHTARPAPRFVAPTRR